MSTKKFQQYPVKPIKFKQLPSELKKGLTVRLNGIIVNSVPEKSKKQTVKQSLINQINEQIRIGMRDKEGKARMAYRAENPILDIDAVDLFTQKMLKRQLIKYKTRLQDKRTALRGDEPDHIIVDEI